MFIDNIYRYTLAGTEVSALLGRMPSAVGYQPTLAQEMGALQERITSTKTGSITSIQAVYVPADDLTDPSPATTFAHLDATVVLSRNIAEISRNWVSTLRWIHLTPPAVSSTHWLLVRNITTQRVPCRTHFSVTKNCVTSSRSSAWTSFRKKTSLLFLVHERFSVTCLNHSS